LQAHVETPLAKKIIGGELREENAISIDAGDDGLEFKTE